MRGDWAPVRLTTRDRVVVVVVLGCQATLRGLDYLTGPELPPLSVIQAAAPAWLWGIAFTAAGCGLLLGVVGRWHRLVWAAHVTLATLYVSIMAGGLAYVVGVVHWDQWRNTTELALVIVLHAVWALRTGPSPLRPGEVDQ